MVVKDIEKDDFKLFVDEIYLEEGKVMLKIIYTWMPSSELDLYSISKTYINNDDKYNNQEEYRISYDSRSLDIHLLHHDIYNSTHGEIIKLDNDEYYDKIMNEIEKYIDLFDERSKEIVCLVKERRLDKKVLL